MMIRSRTVLAALLLPLLAAPALACSCAGDRTPEQLDDAASAVFSGRVLSFENGRAEIAVIRSVKGGVSGTVSVSTPAQSSACGVRFTPGETWPRIRVKGGPGRYATRLCDYGPGMQ